MLVDGVVVVAVGSTSTHDHDQWYDGGGCSVEVLLSAGCHWWWIAMMMLLPMLQHYYCPSREIRGVRRCSVFDWACLRPGRRDSYAIARDIAPAINTIAIGFGIAALRCHCHCHCWMENALPEFACLLDVAVHALWLSVSHIFLLSLLEGVHSMRLQTDTQNPRQRNWYKYLIQIQIPNCLLSTRCLSVGIQYLFIDCRGNDQIQNTKES